MQRHYAKPWASLIEGARWNVKAHSNRKPSTDHIASHTKVTHTDSRNLPSALMLAVCPRLGFNLRRILMVQQPDLEDYLKPDAWEHQCPMGPSYSHVVDYVWQEPAVGSAKYNSDRRQGPVSADPSKPVLLGLPGMLHIRLHA